MLSSLLPYLDDALAVAVVIGIVYQVAALISVRRFARLPQERPDQAPAVTILKPVYGLDAGLYDNLRSFCLQDRHSRRPNRESLPGATKPRF